MPRKKGKGRDRSTPNQKQQQQEAATREMVERSQPSPVERFQPQPVERFQPPPVERFQPPPVERFQPPPVERFQPPPVGRSQPPPVGRSLPPPVGRSQPPPVGRSQPPPVGRSQPPPVGRSQPPPVGRSQPPPVGRSQPPPVERSQPPLTKRFQLPPAEKFKTPGALELECTHTPQGQSKIKNISLIESITGPSLDYNPKPKLDCNPFCRRPGVGTLGRKIGLLVNYFPMEIPSGFVYHYDVDIMSINRRAQAEGAVALTTDDKKYRCMSIKRNREVINAMLKVHRQFQRLKPAYDGRKNLYTKWPLEGVPYSLTVVLDDSGPPQEENTVQRGDEFSVSIKAVKKKEADDSCAISLDRLHELFNGKLNYVPHEAVMALETILRSGPCFRHVPVGRSFFSRSFDGLQPLGSGKDIWFGYHQSLHLGQWQPMININMTATTFYKKGPVIEFICELLNCSRQDLHQMPQLKDAERTRLTEEMKNLRIKVTHLRYPRKYRIVKLTRDPVNKLTFDTEEGGHRVKKKVSDYFFEQYNKKLEFPHLPCLQVAPENKNIYLPLEVCEILDEQHCKEKLAENQTSVMIKAAAIPPKERFEKIKSIVRDANFNGDDYNRQFGLRINEAPMKVVGRILFPPNVCYEGQQRILPKDGSWDMREKQFLHGAEIGTWVLLSFAEARFCGPRELDRFAHMLCDVGTSCGILLRNPVFKQIIDTRRNRVDDVLRDIKARYKADLAVIVIPEYKKSDSKTPEHKKGIYEKIKQVAETSLSLVTQCVKDTSVVRKCNPALVSNLCLKINAKMGGINNSLTLGEKPEILRKPVIIIGADVTHPGPSNDIKPSIAAVVGSLDEYPSRYAVTVRAQKHQNENKRALETIVDLQAMVIELLKAFYKNTRGKRPEKIIFYRDGVSEGQFETVHRVEIAAVRKACHAVNPEYEPGITFIVVQKRHHTRFMPQDHREGVGRMKNIPPGTTVDQQVTHPLNNDFFLCSHFGLQGTSRPSHYTVLTDDNRLSADDLQKLTYYLCHTYVRCTKSISVPAPVQYAHLAAFRARQHLLSQRDESSTSNQTSAVQELPQNIKDAIKVKDDLKNTMYFV